MLIVTPQKNISSETFIMSEMFLHSKSVLSVLFILLLGQRVHGANETLQDYVKAEILDWIYPKFLISDVHYYHSGYDYDDKPVIVLEWGHWKYLPITEKGGEDLRSLTKLWDQLLERVKVGYFRRKTNDTYFDPNDNEVAFIWDFDGFQLGQLSSIKFVKFAMHRAKQFDKIADSIAYGFIVNANPMATQFLSLIKPFTQKYLQKMEIHGTNSKRWIPEILKKIPRSELQPAYGGTKDFLPVGIYG